MSTARGSLSIASRALILGIILALAFLVSACKVPVGDTRATPDPQAAATHLPSIVPTETASPTAASTHITTLPAASAGAPLPEGWQVYRSQQYAFELSYPPKGVLVDDQLVSARIDLPCAPGTNLQEKYLQIDVQESADQCQSPMAGGYSPGALEQAQVEAGSTTFQRQMGSEGAAGNFYDWIAYITTREGLCIRLTFVLHSLNADNFETPLPEFDLQGESEVFNSIIASFEWLQ